MKTTQAELLASQTNANEPDNSNSSNEIHHREQVPNTPFWIIGNETKGYILVMGKHKLTETKQTPDAVKKLLKNDLYNIMLKMMIAIFETISQINNENNKTTEQ